MNTKICVFCQWIQNYSMAIMAVPFILESKYCQMSLLKRNNFKRQSISTSCRALCSSSWMFVKSTVTILRRNIVRKPFGFVKKKCKNSGFEKCISLTVTTTTTWQQIWRVIYKPAGTTEMNVITWVTLHLTFLHLNLI